MYQHGFTPTIAYAHTLFKAEIPFRRLSPETFSRGCFGESGVVSFHPFSCLIFGWLSQKLGALVHFTEPPESPVSTPLCPVMGFVTHEKLKKRRFYARYSHRRGVRVHLFVVCMSVCSSHCVIVSKRRKLKSQYLYCGLTQRL